MPRSAPPSALGAARLLIASVALAVASWFTPWSRPAPGTGSAGFYPDTASPWGDFAHMVGYADHSPGNVPTLAIFGALLFGPPALLAVGAIATTVAVRPWVRAATVAVVVLASVAGMFFTAIFALASTIYGHAIDFGAALSLVGYMVLPILSFLLPRRPALAAGATPPG